MEVIILVDETSRTLGSTYPERISSLTREEFPHSSDPKQIMRKATHFSVGV